MNDPTDIEKCRLTRYPVQVLAQPAKPIDRIDDNVRQLADKMIDIMLESGGIGLAGPQAGVGLSIFVVSVDGTRENAKVYINPQISVSGGQVAREEGCLSLPAVVGNIKRYKNCTVTATDLDGNEFTEEAEGLTARAFQHEYDHLEGVLITSRMSIAAKIAARKRLKELDEDFKNLQN